MIWAAPECSWLLLLAMPAALLPYLAARVRRQAVAELAGVPLTPRRSLAPYAGVCALALIVTALCRPQWKLTEERDESRGIDIVVALDVSRSMLADDVAPTRLGTAKEAIAELAQTLRGDRVALIAFAGSAFTVCPLTHDYSIFQDAVEDTSPETFPFGGTRLSTGLAEALRAFGDDAGRGRALVVVSDGEDLGEFDPLLSDALRRAGVAVHGVVVGTEAGALIPQPDGAFVRDRRGSPVVSRARSDGLRRLAQATDGSLIKLGEDRHALAGLRAAALAALPATTTTAVRALPVERYQWPLALALMLLLAPPLVERRGRQ